MTELWKACRALMANDSLVDSRQHHNVLERALPVPIDVNLSFAQHSVNRFAQLEVGLNTARPSQENRGFREPQSRSSTTGTASLLILL